MLGFLCTTEQKSQKHFLQIFKKFRLSHQYSQSVALLTAPAGLDDEEFGLPVKRLDSTELRSQLVGVPSLLLVLVQQILLRISMADDQQDKHVGLNVHLIFEELLSDAVHFLQQDDVICREENTLTCRNKSSH